MAYEQRVRITLGNLSETRVEIDGQEVTNIVGLFITQTMDDRFPVVTIRLHPRHVEIEGKAQTVTQAATVNDE